MASNKKLAFLIMFLFLSVSLTPSLSPSRRIAAQTSSCPANQTLRGTDIGGAPNSVNYLTTGGAGFYLANMLYMAIGPIITPDGRPDLNLTITDWIQHNANYSQWTFNIKPGAKWSDGTPITSADILATYSPRFAFNATYDFTGVHKEVTNESALNSSAVQFTLNKSDATFPVTLGPQVLTAVYPASAIKGPDTTFFNAISSGPYYMVNYTQGGTTMKLVKNPYYTPAAVPCELDITFPESTSTSASLLIAGSEDYGEIDSNSAGSVAAHPDLHVFNETATKVMPLLYNSTIYPFNMTQFRQALVYGINESQIAQQACAGYCLPAYSSEGNMPPTYTANYNPNQMKYSFNQSKAMSILTSLGFTKGSDGSLHYPNGTAVSFTFWADNTYAEDVLATQVIQSNLQQLGISLDVHAAKWGTIFGFTSLQGGTIYMAQNGAVVYANPQISALPGWDVYTVPAIIAHHWMWPANADSAYFGNLSIIQNTTDPAAVKNALNNIQALGAQYLPVIPLVYPSRLYGYSTKMWSGWPPFPSTWFYQGASVDSALFSRVQPTSGVTSTATSSTSMLSLGNSTSATASIPSSTMTTASTPASPGLDLTTIAIVAVVVVIIIVAVAAFAMRRRR